MIESGKYEIMPILMRYALFRVKEFLGNAALGALEASGAPEALIPLLAYSKWMYGGLQQDSSPPEHIHTRLVELLGRDVGRQYAPWEELLDGLEKLPSRIPQHVRKEMRRTIDCYSLYVDKSNLLTQMEWRLAQERLEAEGFPHFLNRVREARIKLLDIPPEDQARLERCMLWVGKRVAVKEPNLDVLTTDEFVAEIEAFAAAVDKVYESLDNAGNDETRQDTTTTKPGRT